MKKNWDNVSLIDYDKIQFDGPVRIERSQRLGEIEYFISTSAIGSKITIPFIGTGLIIATMFGCRFIKFMPSDYVLKYKNNKITHEGVDLSFFYYAPTTSVVVVPIASIEAPFMFEEVTGDY